MQPCKFTTDDIYTRNQTLWEPGIAKTIIEDPDASVEHQFSLCNDKWFHYYRSPYHAALFHSFHLNNLMRRLWLVEVNGHKLHEIGKSGAKSMKLLHDIDNPPNSVYLFEKHREFIFKLALLLNWHPEFIKRLQEKIDTRDYVITDDFFETLDSSLKFLIYPCLIYKDTNMKDVDVLLNHLEYQGCEITITQFDRVIKDVFYNEN